VRIAATVIAIICAVNAIAGVVLRFLHLPGGSTLFLLFTGMMGIAATLYLFHQRKQNSDKLKRISDVIGLLAIWQVLIMLLFLAQNWPGWNQVILQSIVLVVAWMVLHIIARKRAGVVPDKPGLYHVSLLVFMLCVGASRTTIEQRADETEASTTLFLYEQKSFEGTWNALTDSDSLRVKEAGDSSAPEAMNLVTEYRGLITYIEQMKLDLVDVSNNDAEPNDTSRYALVRPEDFDIPTYYFLGANPQFPEGSAKGPQLYGKLLHFKENTLHADVKFTLPLKDDIEFSNQWLKDNFYHTTAIDALTRLTTIQNAILQSVKESFDRKLFRKIE
jgi:hypothetical protein